MSERERSGRMPQETPERSGDSPPREWPARAEAGAARDAVDEVAEEPFATQTPPEVLDSDDPADLSDETAPAEGDAELEAEAERTDEPELPPAPAEELEAEAGPEDAAELAEREAAEHAAGEVDIPDGYNVIEGYPAGHRRTVAVVVARFNGDITNRMLTAALEELDTHGVPQESVTVMPVPGAFELPLGAMALAKTRRYSCIVTLGCVIRGETPHFEYVASEAASGVQLAGIETGIPVAFGVLTCDTRDQAEARIGKAAEAVRTALEMADVFGQVRAKTRA